MSKTYYELLKDPQWQRRRLEIMNAANFECDNCGASEKTLTVHHKRYIKGLKPWEYEDQYLICLCEDCHKEHHKIDDIIKDKLSLIGGAEKDEILGVLMVMELFERADENYRIIVDSPHIADGVAMWWGRGVKGNSIIDFILSRPTDRDYSIGIGDLRSLEGLHGKTS